MRGKIEHLIRGFVEGYQSLNQTQTDWDEPLAGFADADDPLFEKLEVWVSDTHLLPKDLLPNARSVITSFIPFKKETVLSNQGGKKASSEWAKAYLETNKLIVDLNHCGCSLFF
jgi:hypothetical protein